MNPSHNRASADTAQALNQTLVHTHVHNGIATLTLDRPKALNALNLDMVQALWTALNAWANDPAVIAVVLRSSSPKALCAGGDIRYFHAAASAGQFDELDGFFAQEYALNLLIANYPKPYIAVMQGVVMGGGMGISATAALRIVTDNSKLAMPETKIGLFPDVGGTHFLSHLSGQLGAYLGLTGCVLDAASARYVGLADAYCPPEALPVLFDTLATQRFVDGQAVLHYLRCECAKFAGTHPLTTPRSSPLASQRAWIDAHFAGNDFNAIMDSLARAAVGEGEQAHWATECLAGLQSHSPLMLHVTLKALRNAQSLNLAQALEHERALMKRCFAHGEPIEGIRALAVDKDHAPKWSHACIAAVSADELAAW